MSLSTLRGFFSSFNSTGWVESEPFYYTCVNIRTRPIQITSFVVYHQPTDVTCHSVRSVGKLPVLVRAFVWQNIVSHPEIERTLIKPVTSKHWGRESLLFRLKASFGNYMVLYTADPLSSFRFKSLCKFTPTVAHKSIPGSSIASVPPKILLH